MAKSATTEHHERGGRELKRQPHRFLGLFLSPLAGLPTAWLIHVWTMGVNLHWGPITWVVRAGRAAPFVAVALITLATVGLSVLAWHFAAHRRTPMKATLAGSVGALGMLFAINVGTGPHYWWSGLFLIAGWAVALAWSLARLDVTRNDKSTGEEKDDTFLEKVGLKGWRHRSVRHITDDAGEVLATEIDMQHAPGDTIDQLQEAVPAFESVSGSPRGSSRAVGSDRADQSTLTIMHRDPLKVPLPAVAASAPGGCISEPLVIGRYSTGALTQAYLAGGAGFSPSSYLFMGMNRTGKTFAENQVMTEVISRRNAVILYLNRAKGMQDVRTIIPGVEVAVIADEADEAGLYRQALKKVKAIMSYRQRQLALFGIAEWNAEQCWNSPPWRTEAGRRVQMERMPFLIVHVAEADAILQSAGTDAVYVTSKGLSLGVCSGWSLQRADHMSMPTNLRFNIGTAWCFGCGDDISASFALSEPTIKAGARPDFWKQSKPGYHFFEGLNIDDELFPVAARSFSTTKNGGDLREELLRRNLYWGPRMAKLDQGSVLATIETDEDGKPTEPWWNVMARRTDDLRKMLLAGGSATVQPAPATSADEDEDEDPHADEAREELATVTNVEGVELYPQTEDGERDRRQDATAELSPPTDPQNDVSWEDDRPAPRDRQAAIDALDRAYAELAADANLRDPADPTGRTVIITAALIADRYPFRSRPFFSEVLASQAAGETPISSDRVLSRATDLGLAAGKYRLVSPHGE